MRYIFTLILSCFLIGSCIAIFPPPKYQSFSGKVIQLHHRICDLQIRTHPESRIEFNHIQFASQISKTFLSKLSGCNSGINHLQQSAVSEITLTHNKTLKKESYHLIIEQDQISLETSSYQGYVYGLQTLSQIISEDLTIPLGTIYDEPLVEYRGIMIDTARHFISVQTIKKLIKTMTVVKLNILHWHLSDDQSFSFCSGSHPEVTQYGSFGKNMCYSAESIKEILAIAKENAVKVIPQIDTPAAVRSWSLSPSLKSKNLTIQCNKGKNYFEQLDISKKQSLSLVQDIVRQVDTVFSESPYIHLGGDRISEECWNLRPAMKTFKTLHNLKNISDIVNFWRYQVKQALPRVRKVIHWQDDQIQIKYAEGHVIQYNGPQDKAVQVLKTSESKVILSPRDVLGLGSGFGGMYGVHDEYDHYNVWKADIYNKFVMFPQGIDKERILGAEVVLEGHNTNEDQFENNLWMRAAAFSGRVWSAEILPFEQILIELVTLEKKLTEMGIAVSPVTVEICYKTPKGCLPSQSLKSRGSIEIEEIVMEE